jgi:hypothetical protein
MSKIHAASIQRLGPPLRTLVSLGLRLLRWGFLLLTVLSLLAMPGGWLLTAAGIFSIISSG